MKPLYSLFFCVLFCSGCGNETYPPIVDPPTYAYRYGEFVWHELGCTNMAETKQFYSEVFGWTFEDYEIPEIKYSRIIHDGRPIGGAIESTVGGMNQWVGAISVKKPGNVMETAVNNGAVELIGNTTLAGRGSMGLLQDPQGAIVSVIQSFNGDPETGEARVNNWMWMELWSGSPEKSVEFYTKFYAFDTEETDVDDKPYWLFNLGEESVAGLIKNPVDNMRSQWVPYIRVEDPADISRRVRAAGGSVLMAPRDDIRKGSVAVLSDPGGAIFCVQKWPIN